MWSRTRIFSTLHTLAYSLRTRSFPHRKKYVSGRLTNDAFDDFQWKRFIVWVSMKLFHAGKHPHWTTTAEHHRWTAAHSMRRYGPPLRRAACIFGRKKMMNHDYQVQIIVQLNSSELNILIAISGVISLNLFFWIIRSHLEWRTKRCVTALPRCSPTLVQNAYSECSESVRSLLNLFGAQKVQNVLGALNAFHRF